MKWNRFLYHKLPYLGAIVLLLVPISWLSMPRSGKTNDPAHSPGGQLAQLRSEYGLAQDSLGDIDPTSETIRLTTLGLRPVAANVLWYKANEFKKREDWHNMMATVDTITKLQPHFISVWRFQAWNLSYNVSVEWDDYRDRYSWVIRGIDFLYKGTEKNRKEPTLLWDTGWFVSQKIGKSDEHADFRKLFRDDEDFHKKYSDKMGVPVEDRDSWLVGKSFYLRAQKMVDDDPAHVRIKGLSANVMHAEVPLNQIHFAEALVKEGSFGERSRQAWAKALREWAGEGPDSYGQRLLATPAGALRMNDFDKYNGQAKELIAKIKAFDPTVYDRLYQAKLSKLTAEEQEAVKATTGDKASKASDHHLIIASQVGDKLKIDLKELAQAMPEAHRKEAMELAMEALEAEHIAYWIKRYGEIVNFPYWKTRCLSEQTRNTQDAHEQLYKARKAAPQGHFEDAQDAFELSMEHTRVALEEHRLLLEDQLTGQDLFDVIREYQQVLGHLDEKFPVMGYGLIAGPEVADWTALCRKLSGPESTGLPKRIADYWTEQRKFPWAEAATTAATQVASSGKIDDALKTDLMYGINKAIQWPDLVRESDLTGVELRPALASQVTSDRKKLAPRLSRQFNRQVLEDALGKAILVPMSDPPGFVLENLMVQHKSLVKEKLLPFSLEPTPAKKPEEGKAPADEKKADEKAEPAKKSDEKKSDEKKADEKKADEKKADEPAKKVEETKAVAPPVVPPSKAAPATPPVKAAPVTPPAKAVTPPAKAAPVPAKK